MQISRAVVRRETWAGAERGATPNHTPKQENTHVPPPPFHPPVP